MTHRLILTRHAKSSWDDLSLSDAERPLNARGHASARLLGEWLASRGYVPEEVLSSHATRTLETWAGIRAAMASDARLRIFDSLYHAEPEQMWSVLKVATAATVLMLGHNPGIAAFARQLPVDLPLDAGFDHYPTGATLVVNFDIASWADVKPRTGRLMDFITPRELE